MKYYGIIVDTLSRGTERISGDFSHKPTIENAGWFCSCHWFTDYDKALIFQLHAEKVFLSMDLKEACQA